MVEERRGRGRPKGKDFPCDIRVRLSEDLRLLLVSFGEQTQTSLSEVVRQALEAKLEINPQR